MEFHPLSERERRQFEADGFAIWRQALPEAQVAALRALAERLVASPRREMRQQEGLMDGFRNCVALDPAIAALVSLPRAVSWAMQLLSPNLQLHTSHLIVSEPAPPGADPERYATGWHRDIYPLPEDLGDHDNCRVELKIAYYLSAGNASNGVTRVARGSHRWRAPPAWDARQEPPAVVVPDLAPGDALLFENRTWHAARINTSGARRIVLILGYSYRWMRPDDWTAQAPSLLAGLDPAARELLTPTTRRAADGSFTLAPAHPWLVEWARQHHVQGHAAWEAAQRQRAAAATAGAGEHQAAMA